MILSKFARVHWLGACILLLGSALAHAQSESVQIKRASELREAPGESSRSLAALAVRTPVTRSGQRQGAWIQVRTAEGTNGWVHMFDVSSSGSTAPTGVGTDAMRGVANFFNKGSAQGGTVTATSTLGIRGLGAQDLARSQPSLGAVDQADALRVDGDQARQFATSAALSSRQVDALPEAAPVPAQTNNPTQSNIN